MDVGERVCVCERAQGLDSVCRSLQYRYNTFCVIVAILYFQGQNTFSLPHVYANANVYILTHTCAGAHLRFRERGLRSVSLALAFAAASVIQLPIAVRTL